MSEVKKVDLPNSASSMVLSKDGTVLVVTYAKTISFWDTERYVTHYSSLEMEIKIAVHVLNGYILYPEVPMQHGCGMTILRVGDRGRG